MEVMDQFKFSSIKNMGVVDKIWDSSIVECINYLPIINIANINKFAKLLRAL